MLLLILFAPCRERTQCRSSPAPPHTGDQGSEARAQKNKSPVQQFTPPIVQPLSPVHPSSLSPTIHPSNHPSVQSFPNHPTIHSSSLFPIIHLSSPYRVNLSNSSSYRSIRFSHEKHAIASESCSVFSRYRGYSERKRESFSKRSSWFSYRKSS